MEPTKVYQYIIPSGLRLSKCHGDSPSMALDILKYRRITPFSIADILGLNMNETGEEPILKPKENEG